MFLGAHFSIAGGYHKACEEAARLGCNALQLFTRNQMQWKAKPIADEEARRFREARKEAGVEFTMAHDSYLINLASPNAALRRKSLASFIDELHRCKTLGVEYLVTHPGSPVDAGEETGLKNMALSLRNALKEGSATTILLETTAGQGRVLGWRFEQIARMIEDCDGHEKLAVCVDTQHIFAAGYDIRTDEAWDETFESFDRMIGIDRLRAFHVNDSKQPLGARVDRHEHIGKGKIGRGAFRRLMTDPRFGSVPKVLETPKKGDMDSKNLAVLRELAREAPCPKQ